MDNNLLISGYKITSDPFKESRGQKSNLSNQDPDSLEVDLQRIRYLLEVELEVD
ncbi:MAG: hypothetical protein JKY52_19345 [Flavobacteriales bacterium]|nr:hypothetical protein [Flavobacteriales bacterium]